MFKKKLLVCKESDMIFIIEDNCFFPITNYIHQSISLSYINNWKKELIIIKN